MASRKQQIVSRITQLERIVKDSNAEINRLTHELETTPAALLDRDDDEQIRAATAARNDFLRSQGLLPPKE